MFSWRVRRQLFYFTIFAGIIGLVGWRVFVYFTPAPTCFDGKQNQEEQGVDCGGPCKKCVGDIRDLTVVWARLSPAAGGRVDVSALVDNPNLLAGSKSLPYRFKLYDDQGVTVAIRDGVTFLNSAERFVIFEPNIDIKARAPQRVIIEFPDISTLEWQRIETLKPNLIVIQKNFVAEPSAALEARIRNGEVAPQKDVTVAAILYDEEDNVLAASATLLDEIPAGGERSAYFTWGIGLGSTTPQKIDVLVRVNQTR